MKEKREGNKNKKSSDKPKRKSPEEEGVHQPVPRAASPARRQSEANRRRELIGRRARARDDAVCSRWLTCMYVKTSTNTHDRPCHCVWMICHALVSTCNTIQVSTDEFGEWLWYGMRYK